MAQPIDATTALELITKAEKVRQELQNFINALRFAADETIDDGQGIAQGPGGAVPPH